MISLNDMRKLTILFLSIAFLFGCSDKTETISHQASRVSFDSNQFVNSISANNANQLSSSNQLNSSSPLSSATQADNFKELKDSKRDGRSKHAKPGAPVILASAAIVFANPDEPTSVDIVLNANAAGGLLEIDLITSDGLHLIDTLKSQIVVIPTSQIIKLPVRLLAPVNGRYYLNMHIRLNNGESNLTRNLAVIVQVGAEANKATQFRKPSGENVISLPAQEKISAQ